MGLVLYVVLKIAAYIAVCYVGLGVFRPMWGHRVSWAAGLGFGRFVMGLIAGLAIYILSNNVYLANQQSSYRSIITYASVYLPVRWLEWTLMALVLVPGPWRPFGVVGGVSASDRYWRLGGIAVSCLADIPVFLEIGGLPVGRFFC